jgi:hypothetical protein
MIVKQIIKMMKATIKIMREIKMNKKLKNNCDLMNIKYLIIAKKL